MYASILKGVTILGLFIHGLKFFSLLVPAGCPFALLPFLVGFRYNYLYLSWQVIKLKTKSNPNFSSSSGVYYRIVMLYKLRSRGLEGDLPGPIPIYRKDTLLNMMAVGNLNALTAYNYSTLATPRSSINQQFVTGFIDAGGSLSIIVVKNKTYKTN